MRLPDDDELYEIDETYLGPPGRYLGEMRHRTIFAFLVIAPVSMVALRQVGMPLTLLTVGLWLLAALWASMTVADHTGRDSSAMAAGVTLWHEVTAPRPPQQGTAAVAGPTFTRSSGRRGGWARAERRERRRAERAAATAARRASAATRLASAQEAEAELDRIDQAYDHAEATLGRAHDETRRLASARAEALAALSALREREEKR